VQHFSPLAQPAEQSLDTEIVRYVGNEFATYIDSDSAAPFMTGLRGALEAPLHNTQVLNTAVALSNVVALLALSLSRDESTASDLVTGSMAQSAGKVFPELVPANDAGVSASAEALVCRVFGTVTLAELPDSLDGRTLAAIAAYGDAGIMLADEVGLPRPALATAIGQAASHM
jgi:hypothetical protein